MSTIWSNILSVMEKRPPPSKRKNNKSAPAPAKTKSSKKRKISGGPTCSLFLSELTRKLTRKKQEENETPGNIVQTIIESITNALPVKFTKRTPPIKDSPIQIEKLAPELLPSDTIEVIANKINPQEPNQVDIIEDEEIIDTGDFKMPKMPVANSDVFKKAAEQRRKTLMEDVAVNTSNDHDVATELRKHMGTLKKISLIAEEFNQKTAKNLKEIVDSVQEDLIKKLEEVQAKQRAKSATQKFIEEEVMIQE